MSPQQNGQIGKRVLWEGLERPEPTCESNACELRLAGRITPESVARIQISGLNSTNRFPPTSPFSMHPKTHLSGLMHVGRGATADRALARLQPSATSRGRSSRAPRAADFQQIRALRRRSGFSSYILATGCSTQAARTCSRISRCGAWKIWRGRSHRRGAAGTWPAWPRRRRGGHEK